MTPGRLFGLPPHAVIERRRHQNKLAQRRLRAKRKLQLQQLDAARAAALAAAYQHDCNAAWQYHASSSLPPAAAAAANAGADPAHRHHQHRHYSQQFQHQLQPRCQEVAYRPPGWTRQSLPMTMPPSGQQPFSSDGGAMFDVADPHMTTGVAAAPWREFDATRRDSQGSSNISDGFHGSLGSPYVDRHAGYSAYLSSGFTSTWTHAASVAPAQQPSASMCKQETEVDAVPSGPVQAPSASFTDQVSSTHYHHRLHRRYHHWHQQELQQNDDDDRKPEMGRWTPRQTVVPAQSSFGPSPASSGRPCSETSGSGDSTSQMDEGPLFGMELRLPLLSSRPHTRSEDEGSSTGKGRDKISVVDALESRAEDAEYCAQAFPTLLGPPRQPQPQPQHQSQHDRGSATLEAPLALATVGALSGARLSGDPSEGTGHSLMPSRLDKLWSLTPASPLTPTAMPGQGWHWTTTWTSSLPPPARRASDNSTYRASLLGWTMEGEYGTAATAMNRAPPSAPSTAVAGQPQQRPQWEPVSFFPCETG